MLEKHLGVRFVYEGAAPAPRGRRRASRADRTAAGTGRPSASARPAGRLARRACSEADRPRRRWISILARCRGDPPRRIRRWPTALARLAADFEHEKILALLDRRRRTVTMTPDDGRPEDILIVDDTPANLRLLSQMLSAQGYRVRAVTSGARALASAQAAAAQPDPARHPHAGDERLRGLRAAEGRRAHPRHPGDLHQRAGRPAGQGAGLQGRRRGLYHQAVPARGGAGAGRDAPGAAPPAGATAGGQPQDRARAGAGRRRSRPASCRASCPTLPGLAARGAR